MICMNGGRIFSFFFFLSPGWEWASIIFGLRDQGGGVVSFENMMIALTLCNANAALFISISLKNSLRTMHLGGPKHLYRLSSLFVIVFRRHDRAMRHCCYPPRKPGSITTQCGYVQSHEGPSANQHLLTRHIAMRYGWG